MILRRYKYGKNPVIHRILRDMTRFEDSTIIEYIHTL